MMSRCYYIRIEILVYRVRIPRKLWSSRHWIFNRPFVKITNLYIPWYLLNLPHLREVKYLISLGRLSKTVFCRILHLYWVVRYIPFQAEYCYCIEESINSSKWGSYSYRNRTISIFHIFDYYNYNHLKACIFRLKVNNIFS